MLEMLAGMSSMHYSLIVFTGAVDESFFFANSNFSALTIQCDSSVALMLQISSYL